jgi:CHAT domain-containing protein
VPNAPGQVYLPGVTEEARLIGGLMHNEGTRHLTLESNLATKAMTVQNMEHFSCIHLACHATQNPEDPLRSRFFLQDGTLDLSTIIKANLPSADLAFLSACQTSRGDEKFTEEVLHLAAGMLAAGYRSVVATMWSIRDTHAPGLAESFYAYLLRKSADNGRVIDGSLAAFALHHAARELREKLDDSNESFMSWVPYVHWGV